MINIFGHFLSFCPRLSLSLHKTFGIVPMIRFIINPMINQNQEKKKKAGCVIFNEMEEMLNVLDEWVDEMRSINQ